MANNDKKPSYQLFVNGTEEDWTPPQMTYAQAIKLAFPSGTPGSDIRYTVSWTKPDGQEGSLRQGQHVDVVDGMIFDVRNTDKS